jgi:hypothetical protein
VRDPHATHQLRLTDIQRRDPNDDLLVLFVFLQHFSSSPRVDHQVVARKGCTG